MIALEELRYDVFDQLLIAGAQVNTVNFGGHTPLMQAARNGAVEQARRLLSAGADPNIRDPVGCTAWIAAKHFATDHLLEDVLGPRAQAQTYS